MWSKIAELGVLGFVAAVVSITFGFVVVGSMLDVPGIRVLDADLQQQAVGTLLTLIAGIGGAAAARFGGKGDGS